MNTQRIVKIERPFIEVKAYISRLPLSKLGIMVLEASPCAATWGMGNCVVGVRKLEDTESEVRLIVAKRERGHEEGFRIVPDEAAWELWTIFGRRFREIGWISEHLYHLAFEVARPTAAPLMPDFQSRIEIFGNQIPDEKRFKAWYLAKYGGTIAPKYRKKAALEAWQHLLIELETFRKLIREEEDAANHSFDEIAIEYLNPESSFKHKDRIQENLEFQAQLSRSGSTHISLQSGKPGRKRDPTLDEAHQRISNGSSYIEVFEWYCDKVGIKSPTRNDRAAFKNAMKRRNK